MAENGITVNAICPGYVLTPLVAAQIPETAAARGITEDEVKRDVLLAAQWTKKFVTVSSSRVSRCFSALDAAENITGRVAAGGRRLDGGLSQPQQHRRPLLCQPGFGKDGV